MGQEELREKIYGDESHKKQESYNDYESYEVKNHMKNGAENAITLIANVILILGIIATVICALTTIFVGTPQIDYTAYGKVTVETAKEFNPYGLALTLIILFSTIMQWAFMKVIANISLNIKDINKKLGKVDKK